jgi:WhiB family redox-sensing transcriptional regulator
VVGEGWRAKAACREVDPELFFPQVGQTPQATRAKQVCADCQVRAACLHSALGGPLATDDRYGIFAATTPRERQRLRGRPSAATPTRFLGDRDLAEQALALANQVSIDRAAQQLGVSKQALRHAFAEHGLPQPVAHRGGATPTRLYQDLAAATAAFRRAAAVGINQTRKELGVSDRALRNAWRHHGLGLPPPAGRRTAPAGRPVDAAFLRLNPWLVLPPRLPAGEQQARLRRAEEVDTLGVGVVTELTAESRWPRPAARAWAISRRARRAEQLAQQRAVQPVLRAGRAARRQADRTSRPARRHTDRHGRTDRAGGRANPDRRELPADHR